MIRITLNGTDLDLSDTSLRWESVNSLFADDLQGDYSFPATLKYSAVNMKALGFAHKADVPTVSVTFDVILFLDSRSINSKLIINGTNRNGFNINIAGGVKGLLNSDKSLKDLPYFIAATGEGRVDLDPSFGNMALYQYINWKSAIAFPCHYNPDFYAGANPTFQGVVNRMDATVGNFLLNTLSSGNKYCLVPFIYRHFILKTICDENGLTPIGNYWLDPEAAAQLDYNNYALDKAEDVGCYVLTAGPRDYFYAYDSGLGVPYPIKKDLYMLDSVPGGKDDANNYDDTTFVFTASTAGDYALKCIINMDATALIGGGGYIIATHQHGGTFTDFAVQFFSMTGGFGSVDSFTCVGTKTGVVPGDTITIKIVIDNADLYNGGFPQDESFTVTSANMQIYKYDGAIVNIMDSNVWIKNHVYDITVAEYLQKIKNLAQVEINIDWDLRTFSMNYAEKTITDTAEVDLTELADPNYEQIFDQKSLGFILSYDFGTTDALVTGNFLPIDESKIIGEYIRKADLPVPSFVGDLAIVKNINKVMQVQIISSVFTWVEYSDYYYPITFGKGGTQRKIEFAPMLMTAAQVNESATSDPDDIICLMPAISETGSSPIFDLGINPPSFRTVFMRGKIPAGTYGGNYIYASSTNYDVNGVQLGSYTYKMPGTDGWYARFLQKILLAIDNSAVFEFLIMLPSSYLKYKGKVQIKNVNYLIKNVSMFLGNTVKQSVVKLLKL